MDVGKDPFAPYSGDLGSLRLAGMSLPLFLLSLFIFILLLFIYFVLISNPCISLALQVSNDHL